MTKIELYDRLGKIHHIFTDFAESNVKRVDYQTFVNNISSGLYTNIGVQFMCHQVLQIVNMYNHDYCQNKRYKGDCRLAFMKCYLDIVRMLEAVSDYDR